MTRRIALLVMVLSLMLPVVATADIIVSNVDFYAVYDNVPPPNPPFPPYDGWDVQKNRYGYADPTWGVQLAGGPYDSIKVDNVYVRDWVKWVWLEIDYIVLPPVLPNITIAGVLPPPPLGPGGTSWVTAFDPVINGNNVTWKWLLRPQPDEENIYFPAGNGSFYALDGILRIELATLCVPLPATAWMGLSAMGCLMAFYGWRKARTT